MSVNDFCKITVTKEDMMRRFTWRRNEIKSIETLK
jgi:hypothetical protein